MGSIAGVCQEYSRSPTGGFMDYQDSIRTPGGVHQDLWGSVIYSKYLPKDDAVHRSEDWEA